jgi:ankyrin repeat protein
MRPKSKLAMLVGLIALPLIIIQLTGCTVTPLISAAREGDIARINKLLNEGAKIDEPNVGKWSATPLYWSLYNCEYEAGEFLLNKGANVNIPDSYGFSTLMMAVSWCKNVDVSFVEHLIEKGADVNFADADGKTGLHYAISAGADDVARLLIEKGANVNAIDNNGTTPIILAVQKKSFFIAKLLLQRGADINWCDLHKKSAMSYAMKNDKMMELLQTTEVIPVNKKQ